MNMDSKYRDGCAIQYPHGVLILHWVYGTVPRYDRNSRMKFLYLYRESILLKNLRKYG